MQHLTNALQFRKDLKSGHVNYIIEIYSQIGIEHWHDRVSYRYVTILTEGYIEKLSVIYKIVFKIVFYSCLSRH